MYYSYSFLTEAGIANFITKKNSFLTGSGIGGSIGAAKSLLTSKRNYNAQLEKLKSEIDNETDPYKKDDLIQAYHKLASMGYKKYAAKDFITNTIGGAVLGTIAAGTGHDIYKIKSGQKYVRNAAGKLNDTTFLGSINKGKNIAKRWWDGKIIGVQERKAFNMIQNIKNQIQKSHERDLKILIYKLNPFIIAITGKEISVTNAKVTKSYILNLLTNQQKSILDTAHKSRGELNKLLIATGLLPPIATLGVSIGVSKHYDDKSKVRRYSDNFTGSK